jgi:predicted small metal-binding protein
LRQADDFGEAAKAEAGCWRMEMAKRYRISCRDAGVDCDFQAEASSMDEILQLCAEHGIREHNMKGFGPELYTKMRNCVRIVDGGTGKTEA